MLSGASSSLNLRSVMAANEAMKSTWPTMASDVPGLMRPGQLMTSGMRVPPSKKLYLPPRRGPAGNGRRGARRRLFVAVVEDRAVVTGDMIMVLSARPTARIVGDLAHAPVEFDDRVAARAHVGFAQEAWVRHARHVDVMGGEVQEERAATLLFDESLAAPDVLVRHVLILPQGGFAAFM